MLIRTIEHMHQLLVDALPRIRQLDFDVIVHVPRSGTIPASILATYLRTPFCSVDEYLAGIIPLRKTVRGGETDLKKILIVDDSIRTGKQMKMNIDRILAARPGTRIKKFAVYSTIMRDRVVDADLVLSEHHDCWYIYPWFLTKTNKIQKACFDMDGVLCRDCTREEDDDGEKYLSFIRTAAPKLIPQFPIGAIVTSRLEKYRTETENWLARNGVTYTMLVMHPATSIEQRRKMNPSLFKAEFYRDNPQYNLFVESAVKPAQFIAEISGKTVWCIDNSQIYNNEEPKKC